MATKPELNIAVAYGKNKASTYNENFDRLLHYIEEVSEELNLKVDTINSQLSSSVLSNLQSIYPVGSLYIGTTDTCPIANLFGEWEKVSEGRVLQGVSGNQVAGKTVEAGLPNIRGSLYSVRGSDGLSVSDGALYNTYGANNGANSGLSVPCKNILFDASRSNSIYGKSNTVQPPAYLVNIWKRTA